HGSTHRQRQESAGREAPVGDIVVPVEQFDDGVDGGGECYGHGKKMARHGSAIRQHSKQEDLPFRCVVFGGVPREYMAIANSLESPAMKGIFISYRRQDAAGHAGRLYDRLASHFGAERVFMDVEGIEPGLDFVDAIERAVGSCEVLIVIIGPGWLATDSARKRRLDDPKDFVRIET